MTSLVLDESRLKNVQNFSNYFSHTLVAINWKSPFVDGGWLVGLPGSECAFDCVGSVTPPFARVLMFCSKLPRVTTITIDFYSNETWRMRPLTGFFALSSHITRTTQWEDPRKQLQAQQNLVAHQSADSLLRSPQQAQPQQPTLAQQQGENETFKCAFK